MAVVALKGLPSAFPGLAPLGLPGLTWLCWAVTGLSALEQRLLPPGRAAGLLKGQAHLCAAQASPVCRLSRGCDDRVVWEGERVESLWEHEQCEAVVLARDLWSRAVQDCPRKS